MSKINTLTVKFTNENARTMFMTERKTIKLNKWYWMGYSLSLLVKQGLQVLPNFIIYVAYKPW